ncbi:hypothetical protein Undi14_06435 [Undibacterium sp. 14-3-2]|uniref:hypothetical protein n=1 Tax=Undibacterium sp. 14-3-2 TaxID=2800129 RepID=UPI0019070904|nr:hypothetical protein [Undibacterium sp. 14-3-2]MBK1889667.1 hypothetical protein [Undibacterium sp. 14-3-2]
MNIQGISGASAWFDVAKKTGTFSTTVPAQIPTSARSSDTASISGAARDRLMQEIASQSARSATAAATPSTPAVASFDTDKGSVELNIDDYFSASPQKPFAELPPLLMPSQRNIDALSTHISNVFPKFLSDHGISSAPASISYDSMGQAVFPADYPYTEQLKKALDETPSMARKLMTVVGMTDAKNALDEGVKFQQEYTNAQSQNALGAVIAKYGSLLSGQSSTSPVSLFFSDDGHLRSTSRV